MLVGSSDMYARMLVIWTAGKAWVWKGFGRSVCTARLRTRARSGGYGIVIMVELSMTKWL